MTGRPNLVAALSAVLLVAGCSSSSKPEVLPSLSTRTASPAATDAPVDIPAAARAETSYGADAFARFFFARMNVAFATSNGDLIRELAEARCQTCQNYIKALRASRVQGESLRGDSFAITAVAAPEPSARGSAVVVVGTVPARDVIDAFGRVKEHLVSDGRFTSTLQLVWSQGAWTVSGLFRSTPK